MPKRKDMIEHVANQMMKSGKKGILKATLNQKESFIKRHKKQIIWAIENMPRSHAAVYAVIVKCLIKYEGSLVFNFCYSVKNVIFQGHDDPAHVFWKFLQNKQKKDSISVYKKTVFAIKNYIEKKSIKNIQPSKEDVFDWDEEWTVPDDLLKNWNPEETPKTTNNPITVS
jgi:hypothetical protein